jgi:hypothetical protein
MLVAGLCGVVDNASVLLSCAFVYSKRKNKGIFVISVRAVDAGRWAWLGGDACRRWRRSRKRSRDQLLRLFVFSSSESLLSSSK